jgi:hypothetical protein
MVSEHLNENEFGVWIHSWSCRLADERLFLFQLFVAVGDAIAYLGAALHSVIAIDQVIMLVGNEGGVLCGKFAGN